MKRIYAFSISILITIFIWISFYPEKTPALESSVIKRVVDGDTLVSYDNRTFRLANINSPEKGNFGYLDSMNFLLKLVNKTVEIDSISLDSTKRREVTRIYFEGEYINLRLVQLGLAPKAWVEEKELKIFSNAERDAVEKEQGIWKKSKYYGCLNVSLDKIAENLIIIKKCNNLSLKGLTVRDESRESLKIDRDAENILVKSGNFTNNFDHEIIYWKEQNIWNNDRDTIYIFDSQNKIIYYYSYGYS